MLDSARCRARWMITGVEGVAKGKGLALVMSFTFFTIFRHRRLITPPIAALLLIVVVASGGAGLAQETAESGATPAGASAATDILQRASQRLADTETVHFQLEIEGDTFVDAGENIRLLSAEGDLQRPSRVATSFKASVLGQTVTIQLITVDDESWTTNVLTGNWGEAPEEFAYDPGILFDDQDGIGPVMDRVQEAEQLDDDEIDGREVFRVRAEVEETTIEPLTAGTMTGSPVTVDLWIDRETDDLLRARLAEPSTDDDDEPATWTLDLSDHGDEVSIAPPV